LASVGLLVFYGCFFFTDWLVTNDKDSNVIEAKGGELDMLGATDNQRLLNN